MEPRRQQTRGGPRTINRKVRNDNGLTVIHPVRPYGADTYAYPFALTSGTQNRPRPAEGFYLGLRVLLSFGNLAHRLICQFSRI